MKQTNQHQSVINAVTSVLKKTTMILSVEMMFKMSDMIESHPQHFQDSQFFDFIIFFHTNSCTKLQKVEDQSHLEAFCIRIYSYIQTIMAIGDSDLIRLAYSALINTLLCFRQSIFKDLLKDSALNLKNCTSQIQAALVIQLVINSQYLSHCIILPVLEEYDVLSLLFQGACHFVKTDVAESILVNEFHTINQVIFGLLCIFFLILN